MGFTLPVITETVFSVHGTTSVSPDTFSVSDTSVTISGVSTEFDSMPYTITDSVRKIDIRIKVDSSDATIFYGTNLYDFFGMDYTALTLEELKDVAEILRRFPEEGIWDLAGEFNP